MKAVSLWQPWASLVALGVKTIETRSWSTKYRGQLAIHAAQRFVPGPIGAYACGRHRGDPPHLVHPHGAMGRHESLLPIGAIVATCQLVDVLPITGMNDAGHDEFVCPDIGGGLTLYRFGNGGMFPATVDDDITSQLPYGDFTEGRYAWILDDIAALDPIATRGRQGLWEWRH